MQPSTMAKKIRELHSLAEYICDERGKYKVPASFQDYFLPYLKRIAKIDKYAKTIPVEHIDKIFTEAQDDLQAYCIFALLQRVGLSSTEIVGLKLCDIVAYVCGTAKPEGPLFYTGGCVCDFRAVYCPEAGTRISVL